MIFLIAEIIVEDAVVTKITPSDIATEFRRLFDTARVEHNPSIMRKRALLYQNPSAKIFHSRRLVKLMNPPVILTDAGYQPASGKLLPL